MEQASRHGVVGVRRLELTERIGMVAPPRYLLEPAAGGRGVAETTGGSTDRKLFFIVPTADLAGLRAV